MLANSAMNTYINIPKLLQQEWDILMKRDINISSVTNCPLIKKMRREHIYPLP